MFWRDPMYKSACVYGSKMVDSFQKFDLKASSKTYQYERSSATSTSYQSSKPNVPWYTSVPTSKRTPHNEQSIYHPSNAGICCWTEDERVVVSDSITTDCQRFGNWWTFGEVDEGFATQLVSLLSLVSSNEHCTTTRQNSRQQLEKHLYADRDCLRND